MWKSENKNELNNICTKIKRGFGNSDKNFKVKIDHKYVQ